MSNEEWCDVLLESLSLVEKSVSLGGFMDHIQRCEDVFARTSSTSSQRTRLAEFKCRAGLRLAKSRAAA
ncbi:MAG: hypothetical protein DI528_18580 [Shinella sp.]|nr:MAG: hypothetical protein DI528_18580 [Shinella sp.]